MAAKAWSLRWGGVKQACLRAGPEASTAPRVLPPGGSRRVGTPCVWCGRCGQVRLSTQSVTAGDQQLSVAVSYCRACGSSDSVTDFVTVAGIYSASRTLHRTCKARPTRPCCTQVATLTLALTLTLTIVCARRRIAGRRRSGDGPSSCPSRRSGCSRLGFLALRP